MTKEQLAPHLYSILVSCDQNYSLEKIWETVYLSWADECEKLGFLQKAQYYKIKAADLPTTPAES